MKFDILIYNSQQVVNNFTLYQLNHFSTVSFCLVFICGLFTSLSPCLISVLPVCIMYISGENQQLDQVQKLKNLCSFCLGTISSFIVLSAIITFITKTYSKFFNGIPIISALIIIYMGLNLLNIVPLNTKSFSMTVNNINQNIKMYLSGIGIGLTISSCSTPIFITLLMWINSHQQPFLGLVFIINYSIGYIFPIIMGSIFSPGFLQILFNPLWNKLWAPFSGTILLSAGTFSLFSNILKH